MNANTLTALPLFEGHELRTLTDKTLGLLYHGDDAGKILGYSNTRDAIARHCRTDGVVKRDTMTKNLGRRESTYITEANLLRLIAGSKLPNAEAFERWVFEELVPTVLKTGEYVAPGKVALTDKTRDKIGAITDFAKFLAKMVPGCRKDVLAVKTAEIVRKETGYDMSAMRMALPMSKEDEVGTLSATAVGERIGVSAKEANKRLAAAGLQERNNRDEWQLTSAGKDHGDAIPYERNGHCGWQVMWREGVVRLIQTVTPGPVPAVKLAMFRD